jgi:hypothetical protein
MKSSRQNTLIIIIQTSSLLTRSSDYLWRGMIGGDRMHRRGRR